MLHVARLQFVSIALLVSLSACGGGDSTATSTVASAPAISAQPAAKSIAVGQTASFTVTAAGTAPIAYQWQRNAVSISNATTSSYTTPAQSLADNGAVFAVVVSNATGSTTSSSAALAVTAATIPAATGTDVVTSRNDQARTGQNLTESTLTVANVNTATFGLLRTPPVDGKVDAQLFIADGKVFLGTTTSVGVFGLLH